MRKSERKREKGLGMTEKFLVHCACFFGERIINNIDFSFFTKGGFSINKRGLEIL